MVTVGFRSDFIFEEYILLLHPKSTFFGIDKNFSAESNKYKKLLNATMVKANVTEVYSLSNTFANHYIYDTVDYFLMNIRFCQLNMFIDLLGNCLMSVFITLICYFRKLQGLSLHLSVSHFYI